jgi:hypothetical protein
MSITAMSAARQIVTITPTEKFVLMALCDYASDQGLAWPSLNSLRTWTLLSRRAINTSIASLEAKGLLERRAAMRQNGSQTSNTYRLTFVEADAETADRFFAGRGGVQEVHPPRAGGASPELPREQPEELKPLSTTSTPSLKSTPASSEEPVEDLVAMWNEHCGVLPSVKTVPPARRKKLLAFIRTAGGMKQALETLRRATLVVAADSHWRNGKYGLDNLLAGDKVFARAEQYEAQHTVESAPAGVAVGEAVTFYVMAGNLRVPMTGRVKEVTDTQVVIDEASHGREYRVPFRDVRRS